MIKIYKHNLLNHYVINKDNAILSCDDIKMFPNLNDFEFYILTRSFKFTLNEWILSDLQWGAYDLFYNIEDINELIDFEINHPELFI